MKHDEGKKKGLDMKTNDEITTKICKALRAKRHDIKETLKRLDPSTMRVSDERTIRSALMEASEHAGNTIESLGRRL